MTLTEFFSEVGIYGPLDRGSYVNYHRKSRPFRSNSSTKYFKKWIYSIRGELLSRLGAVFIDSIMDISICYYLRLDFNGFYYEL